MSAGFSTRTSLWLEKRRLLLEAEERFRREWSDVLGEVRKHFGGERWICKPFGPCSEGLKAHRPGWPNPDGAGCHYEIWCDPDMALRRGTAVLGLHVEGEVSDQKAVVDRLRSRLGRYLPDILRNLGKWDARLPEELDRDVIEIRMPLDGMSVADLCEAWSALMCTETFVEEALFARGLESVWRTDLYPGDPRPRSWGGKEGGHRLKSSKGRFGSPSLAVDPEAGANYKEWEGVPTNLLILTSLPGVRDEDELAVSCTVWTRGGGKLWFFGEGHVTRDGKKGYPQVMNPGWKEVIHLPSRGGWCHVGCRLPVRIPADLDTDKNPMSLMLRTQPADGTFVFSTIEVLRRPEQARA